MAFLSIGIACSEACFGGGALRQPQPKRVKKAAAAPLRLSFSSNLQRDPLSAVLSASALPPVRSILSASNQISLRTNVDQERAVSVSPIA